MRQVRKQEHQEQLQAVMARGGRQKYAMCKCREREREKDKELAREHEITRIGKNRVGVLQN
jgi:hypothetical protein